MSLFVEELKQIALDNYDALKYRIDEKGDLTEKTYLELKKSLKSLAVNNGGGVYLVFYRRDFSKHNYFTPDIIEKLITQDGLIVNCLENLSRYIEIYEVIWHPEIPISDNYYIVKSDEIKRMSPNVRLELLEARTLHNSQRIQEMIEYGVDQID